MKLKSQVICILIYCGSFNCGHAQTYQLTVSNAPFVFLENPMTAVDSAWSEPVFQIPLGFDFDFFDITSDQLYSAANSFGGYTSLNQDEEHLYIMLHFYASMIDRGYQQDSALSPIYFKTEGLAGQRVFTLEYNNTGLFHGLEDDNAIFQDYINLQVRLFEGSGDIEYHIGPYSVVEDPEIVFDGFPGPVIGLLANTHNVPGGDVGEIILLTGDALNPTVVTDTIAFAGWPIPENTIYRFSKMGTSVGDNLITVERPMFMPNPTSGEMRLDESIANEILYPILVLDAQGKTIGMWNSETEVLAAGFAAGLYFVIVRAKNNVVTEKLLVLPE